MASSHRDSSKPEVWYKALELDELPEGRVKTVTCGLETVCMTHYQEHALDGNAGAQQSGDLLWRVSTSSSASK